jgi:hypothetical protein
VPLTAIPLSEAWNGGVVKDASAIAVNKVRNEGVVNDASMHLCRSNDLCNGSGRISEISTKMLLLPLFLVLVISMFSG